MTMLRLTLAAGLLLLGGAASAQPARDKAPNPKDLGESLPVLEELGLPPTAGLPAKLPNAYLPDLITAADVRKNPKQHPLRAAVLDAIDVLRDARRVPLTAGIEPRDLTAAGKRAIVEKQQEAAKLILRLEESITALDALAADRKAEPSKRWQAHYDYVSGLLKLQLASMHEYNFALGHIRTDQLPKLDPDAGQTGWRLVPSDKMQSRRDVKDTAEAGRQAMAKVRRDHPNTTWAALAERDAAAKLGLQWEATDLPKPKPKQKK